MTIVEQFSDDYLYNRFGKITGSVAAIQFSSGTCHMIRFKADPANVGTFFIGNDATHCFFPLDAGDDTGWNPAREMAELWYSNPSGTLDYLYWWLKV